MTLAELYELFDLLRPYRRRAAATILQHRFDGLASPPCTTYGSCSEARARLESALSVLDSLPGTGTNRDVAVDDRELRLNLEYEFRELERDLLCLRRGMPELLDSLQSDAAAQRDLESVAKALRGVRYSAVFTDRDGTIANYCGRYRSSHQPLYTAVQVGRFARACAREFFVVTSGPLYGNGLLSQIGRASCRERVYCEV